MTVRGVAAVLLALSGAVTFVPVSAADVPERACRVRGLAHGVRCGHVVRPLDPARPQGPTIEVHYVVIPAKAQRKQPDPVMLLAGGPGQSAIDLAPTALALFTRLNNRRDLVLVDQRGTGRSAPLRCDTPPEASLSDEADVELQLTQLRRCRDTLSALPHVGGIDGLRFFTTALAMQDLDAVRTRLGAARVNLVGVSYGTRAGLEYLRQFPQRTRRVVLDGVAPPDMVLPASMSPDGQAAFDAMLAACEADASCRERHPTLRQDWQRVLASLPARVSLAHPLTGQPQRFTLTRSALLGAVRGPLYAPALTSALPAAIEAAAAGRFEPLAGLNAFLDQRRDRRDGPNLYAGMHFSVVCAEDVPRLATTSDRAGRDFGDDGAALYRRVCADWPRGEVPEAFFRVGPSDVPVLLLSGGLDPVTPPRHGERVSRALGAKARHVVVPNGGHGVMQLGCLRDVLHRFIDIDDAAEAQTVDADCARSMPRPPMFEPVRLPLTGASG